MNTALTNCCHYLKYERDGYLYVYTEQECDDFQDRARSQLWYVDREHIGLWQSQRLVDTWPQKVRLLQLTLRDEIAVAVCEALWDEDRRHYYEGSSHTTAAVPKNLSYISWRARDCPHLLEIVRPCVWRKLDASEFVRANHTIDDLYEAILNHGRVCRQRLCTQVQTAGGLHTTDVRPDFKADCGESVQWSDE